MTLPQGIAALLLILLGLPALADELRLLNGDRITGEVKAMSGDRLVVQTAYAGEISIRWSEIASLSTSRPVELMLQERAEPVRGILQSAYGGETLLIDARGEAVPLSLGDVATINPKPYETGRGVLYAGRALLSAAYTRGNSESDQLHADGELTARAKAYRYNISGRVERRTEPVTGTSSAWLLGGNYDRFLSETHFAYARTSVEHDEAKDVDRRKAVGVGYGLQLFETPAANVSVRGGLDYVAVERIDGPEEGYGALGWGIRASIAPWGPRLELFHEQDGFWNLDDTEVLLVRSKTGLRIPVMDGLNATAQLNVDWERKPAPGRESTDSTLLLGVDYKF